MYLSGVVRFEPSVGAAAAPVEQLGGVAERLAAKLPIAEQAEATRGAVAVLQEVYLAVRSLGITNVVRLAKDEEVIYDDVEGRERDLKDALRAFVKSVRPTDGVVLSELSLLMEHPGDGLHYALDFRIERSARRGRFPLTVTVNGQISALALGQGSGRGPEAVEELRARLASALASQEAHDRLVARHRATFDAFVGTLAGALREQVGAEAASPETGVVVIDSGGRIERPEDVPRGGCGGPVFAGHPGLRDRTFYAWLWSDLCRDLGIECRGCRVVDRLGVDAARVDGAAPDGDGSSVLSLGAMLAECLGQAGASPAVAPGADRGAGAPPSMRRVPCPVCWGQETCFERLLAGFRLERCSSCGMVFVNPQYTEEKLGEIYSVKEDPMKFVDLYARIHTPDVLAEYDRALDRIEALVPAKGRLLDFACAAGYFHETAIRRGWEGHGVDLGQWTKLAADRRGLPNLHVGLLKDMGFPEGHFDVVNATEVLEHLPRPKDDLAEIRRVLRADGILHVTVPNYQCLAILVRRNLFSLNAPPQHINYFTPKTLTLLLEQSGFQVLQLSSGGGLNWENIIGREIESDILDAYRPDAEGEAPPPEQAPRSPSLLKKLVYPAYQRLFNEWAKVGIVLQAFARRPAGDYP